MEQLCFMKLQWSPCIVVLQAIVKVGEKKEKPKKPVKVRDNIKSKICFNERD